MLETNNLRSDFTATGYITNPERTKMIFVRHNKFNTWLPPGGHMEINELPHECVLLEVEEEIGINADIVQHGEQVNLNGASERQIPTPYCILHELIPASSRDVEHMHVDFIYVMVSPECAASLQVREISDAKWLTKEEICSINTFAPVKEIAKKLLR